MMVAISCGDKIKFQKMKILLNSFTFVILFAQIQQSSCSVEGDHLAKEALSVATRHYEPYMYRGIDGRFENGIEFNVIETIASKLGKKIIYSLAPGFISNHTNATR